MNRLLYPFTIFILATIFNGNVSSADSPLPTSQLEKQSLTQLEQRLAQIDSRLSSLSTFSLRSGIGVIGYRSDWRGSPERTEWVEIKLDCEYAIDEIVLMPTLSRGPLKEFRSNAFPNAIRVLAGTDDDRSGTVVAEYGPNDNIQPRNGPLKISTQVTASWVRIEASRLSTRAFDGKHVLQLSEVFLFSGSENVALRQAVTASSNSRDHANAWDMRFLVDGHTPYLMANSNSDPSRAYVSRFGEQPILYLDLGSSLPISQIHLHAVDQTDTVPQAYAGDLGFPNRLKIEGAATEDFSNVQTLLDYERKSINDLGPIMMWRIPETTCRFVRITAAEPNLAQPDLPFKQNLKDTRIGFAEIELYSNGENVASGKRAFADYQPKPRERRPSALTDGKNMLGEILPIRSWLSELAQRQDLERQRPLIAAKLNDRYARQAPYLTWVSWLAAFLALGIGVTFLIGRIFRQRQLAQLKTRFAADLHDELGADLHVIGLLSDLARAANGSPEKHETIHQKIRTMTQRSSDAVRYCTNMLEAKELYVDLLEDMQRTTERIMADFEGEFTYKDDLGILSSLKPRVRADLFLFYKEALVNISRHSNGTRFNASLIAGPDEICLSISDDGSGILDAEGIKVPPSLARRAKLLGASVSVEQPESGGTCVALKIKKRKWGFRR